jgi:3-methyladenine DNA glycosylase AlkD
MPAARMSFDAVMAQLEAWGSEKTRELYARQGAGENQFGVTLGNLRALARKLKTNHPLAMQLWATGNAASHQSQRS